MAWGGRQRAMETAQHWDRLAKNQPAEITMFQISEVQEAPAFNGRRSFLTLRQRSERIHRLTRITRSQPAFGLRRQPELCQQAAEVAAQDGGAVGMVSGDKIGRAAWRERV